MAISTSNTVGNEKLVALCHEFYVVGKAITDTCAVFNISNTTLLGICSEIKTTRTTVNTYHTGILTLLANT